MTQCYAVRGRCAFPQRLLEACQDCILQSGGRQVANCLYDDAGIHQDPIFCSMSHHQKDVRPQRRQHSLGTRLAPGKAEAAPRSARALPPSGAPACCTGAAPWQGRAGPAGLRCPKPLTAALHSTLRCPSRRPSPAHADYFVFVLVVKTCWCYILPRAMAGEGLWHAAVPFRKNIGDNHLCITFAFCQGLC